MLDALCAAQTSRPGYGADADHIQVKRGRGRLERALRLVDASRYYTFYTLDVSDVLDYGALLDTHRRACERQLRARDARCPEASCQACADYCAATAGSAGRDTRMDGDHRARAGCQVLGRAACRRERWPRTSSALKDGARFDLELSIDEHPGEVPTFDCLTGENELVFVLCEARRRGIPLTHVAPNYGVEKGVDYAAPTVCRAWSSARGRLGQIAEEFGVMADFHSGDDLSQATRQAIRRATGGRLHFKVSPMLQLSVRRSAGRVSSRPFRRWWEDARAYARSRSGGGSTFAARLPGRGRIRRRRGAIAPRCHLPSLQLCLCRTPRRSRASSCTGQNSTVFRRPSAPPMPSASTRYLLGLAGDLFA